MIKHMERKVKVLFGLDSMHTGGEEKSLISLLYEMDRTRYDILVLLVHKEGEFLVDIPSDVAVAEVPYTDVGNAIIKLGRKKTLVRLLVRFKLLSFAKILFGGFRDFCFRTSRVATCRNFLAAIDYSRLPGCAFDVAMAYGCSIQMHALIAEKIKAKRKAVWFHCQTFAKSRLDLVGLWMKFDHLVAASASRIEDELRLVFPLCKEKIVRLPIVFSPKACREKSKLSTGFTRLDECVTIFTVGRLTVQKGIDWAIEVAVRLKMAGYKFKWYIGGGGPLQAIMERRVSELNIGDCFVLMGNLKNPYPYFRSCDIYVQPSRHEGMCITLAEAKVFHKPSVSTCFAGALDQIRNGENGLIVDYGADAIFMGVKRLLDNPNLRKNIEAALSAEEFAEHEKVEKISDFILGDY